MDHFLYRQHQLFAEDVPVSQIAAEHGTPVYIYSRATLERHWHAFDDGFGDWPHLICYAVKANSNLGVLSILAKLGSGFDIVSFGELERVLAAGGDPRKIVFSGVGKTTEEITRALEANILCFNIEYEPELMRIEAIAKEKKVQASISIRVNPDVDAKTHPYISTGLKENKFGVAIDKAFELFKYAAASTHLIAQGIDCHIGSQLVEIEPFLAALKRVLELIDRLAEQAIIINHLNMGGGLGVRYSDETQPHPSEYSATLIEMLQGRQLTIILEPGRAIAANAGILVTKIEYLKTHQDKHFAIVDAAMNNMLRPAIYSAYHDIIPVEENSNAELYEYDIVGPICETGDFLGKARTLRLRTKDLLAIRTAGAYCFTMSSNYNSRPRVAEVIVDGDKVHLVRKRESLASLFALENTL
jgi:diaminopimelate decarboxylase